MAKLQVLQHVAMEGPARIGDVARRLGLEVAVHRLYDGAPVPRALAPDDVLVVMGGSMGVGDIGDARWPFLAAEAELLAAVLPKGQPVLGVCLGAQLMAHALGARVYPCTVGDPPARHREVGWGAITFTAAPDAEPALAGVDTSEAVLHWHGDTFDLPAGAVRLASTLACENQMFRFGRRAYALQFHVEVDGGDVVRWVEEDADFVRAANGPGGAARIVADTERLMPRHRRVGDRLIRNVLEAIR
jgi:GMP synthase-like glutamine amidotransferase